MEGPEDSYSQKAGQVLISLKGQLGLNSLHAPGETQALGLNVGLERGLHGLRNKEKSGVPNQSTKKHGPWGNGGAKQNWVWILSKLGLPLCRT